jgi:hypothetical protein
VVSRLSLGHLALCYGTRAVGSSAFVVAVASGLFGACASASRSTKDPVSAWALSLDAQREARTIESAWRDGSDRERLATQPLLLRFLERYPQDPKADSVRLRLARLRIESRDLGAAEPLIQQVALHATGTDADTAQVLRASILSRRGQPAAALAQLREIGRRLVDPETRELWAEETVKVAFLARAFDAAVDLMLDWRSDAIDEHQELAEREIEAHVERIDESARTRALEKLTRLVKQPCAEESRQHARVWMLEVVRASLGKLAQSTNNGTLARRLVADAPTRYLRSPEGEQLRRLAQSSDVPESVMHSAVGILLELDDDRSSRQSAELVTGAMRALASVSKGEPVRLITRELRSLGAPEIDRALSALVMDGAALLIAGLTPKTATIAAEVAEVRQTAVVVLAEPSKSVRLGPFVFVVQSPDPQVEQLFVTAGSESRKMTRLTVEDAFCRAEERSGWTPEFLLSRGDVLVTADATCAMRLADELRTRESSLRVWLGPNAAQAADAFEDASTITSPQLSEQSGSRPVALWQERFQRLPSWNEALGYDVTRLGVEAIKQRGLDSLRGDALVRAARKQVRDALTRVECDLMTTNERGFGGGALLRPLMVARRARTANGHEKAGP